MKSTYTFIFLVLVVYQTDLYSYPKILPVKSNPDYLLITQNTLPIIDLTINLNAGSSHDGSLPGLTNLSFESISKLKYKDEKITDLFENIGAEFHYSVGKDFSTISVRFINNRNNIDYVPNLLNFILTERKINKNDLEFIKEKTNNKIYSQSLQPGSLASIKISEKFFIGTGYSHPVIGYKKSVNSISVTNINNHLEKIFNKESIAINLVGNINENESAHIISTVLNNLPKGKKIRKEPSKIKFNGKMYLNKISMDIKQTHIFILMPGVKRTEESYYSLLVINYLFGGSGFGSTLFNEIRQKRGLAYSVHSYLRPYNDFGVLVINMQTKNENARQAINILKNEIFKLKNNSFINEEITHAKESLLNSFNIRHDTNKKMLGLLSQINYFDMDLDYFRKYENSIRNVNDKSIEDVLQKKLFLEKSIITTVGNF